MGWGKQQRSEAGGEHYHLDFLVIKEQASSKQIQFIVTRTGTVPPLFNWGNQL